MYLSIYYVDRIAREIDLSTGNAAGVNVLRNGWAPRVGMESASQMGSHRYDDAVEEIPLHIKGDSSDGVLVTLSRLRNALRLAQEWSEGLISDPVVLRYGPNSAEYMECVITGPVGAGIDLPTDWHETLPQFYVSGARLKFTRRAMWLGPEEQVTVNASLNHNPGLMTAAWNFPDFDEYEEPFPVSLSLDFSSSGKQLSGLILIGENLIQNTTERIQVYDVSDFTAETELASWATIVDSTAKDGEVFRYTPNSTNVATFSIEISSVVHESPLAAIVLNLKNKSANIDYTITATDTRNYSSATTVVKGGNPDPQAVLVGLLSRQTGLSPQIFLEISVQASESGSVSDALEIDCLGVAMLGDMTTRIIQLNRQDFVSERYLVIDHASLARPEPRIVFDFLDNGSLQENANSQGDAMILAKQRRVDVIPIVNSGSRWGNSSLSARESIGLRAVRRRGVLIPQ